MLEAVLEKNRVFARAKSRAASPALTLNGMTINEEKEILRILKTIDNGTAKLYSPEEATVEMPSITALQYGQRQEAMSFFGEMRDFDEREQQLYDNMLERLSTKTGISFWDA